MACKETTLDLHNNNKVIYYLKTGSYFTKRYSSKIYFCKSAYFGLINTSRCIAKHKTI